jgi:transcriptional regulator with XRE-family HTH domain
MTIGDRLVQERKRIGLSQTAFAKQIGVSLSSQKRYELGEREPDISYLERALRLGMDISYLLTGIRSSDYQTNLGVIDYEVSLFGALAKLLGFTKDELAALTKHVDESMESESYRNLSPSDSILVYDDMFLIAVSELLNKKLKEKEFKNITCEVDFLMLSDILENIELIQQKQNVYLSPFKKARAAVMLYRSFKAGGKIDRDIIEDTVSISGEPSGGANNSAQ